MIKPGMEVYEQHQKELKLQLEFYQVTGIDIGSCDEHGKATRIRIKSRTR